MEKAPLQRTVFLLFLLSGASGLLFETIWTYQATLALGSSTWAVTAVLSAFMAGLGLGNLLALRRSVWTLTTYAILEGTILVTGLLALVLLPALGRLFAPVFGGLAAHPLVLNALRFVLAFLVLAVPSTAMGMTLPALAQALGGEQGSFRAVLGRLYGLNTLGAIGGVLAGELLLLPAAGVFGTGFFAAALNGIAAFGAWKISRGGAAPVEAPWDRKLPASLYPAFVAVFLAGFALLGLEVMWTRFLALFVPNSSLVFALMLATVLAGIAAGGAVGGLPWIRREHGFLLLFGAGVALLACYAQFPLYAPLSEGILTDPWTLLGVGFLLQFPVSFLSGAFFTLAGAEFRSRIGSSQAAAGLLALVNTFGAAVGAVVAGVLLVPGIGVEKSILVVALIYGAAAAIWFRLAGGNRRWLFIGSFAFVAGLAVFPFGQFERRHIPAAAKRWTYTPETTIQAWREGLTETVIYLQYHAFGRPYCSRMLTNSMSMSANTVASDRYMKEFVYWPVALHPGPKRALLICFGVGGTARALTRTRELETIDVVDLSRDVLEMSTNIFPDPAAHPLNDPRVRVHVEDGRFFLQTQAESWDLITGEPPPPEMPGVAGLYSKEYFKLLRERLSEGGIATYWLPIHSLSEPASRSILRAWSDVFETCFLWRGSNRDLLLVGYRGLPKPVSEERFLAQWNDPVTRADLTEVGFDLPETLGSGFIGDGEYIRSISASAEPTEDAYPKRIVAPGSGERPMYTEWFEFPGCADRFAKSVSIGRIWPGDWRERSLPFFPWEAVLTRSGSSPWAPSFPNFPKLHEVLTRTTLKSAVLWQLNSDRDFQRAAAECDAKLQLDPLPQFHFGARALSERDFGRAADHFLRTVGVPGMRRIDLGVCLYALCRAGRVDEAERKLAEVWTPDVAKGMPADYWPWMKSTFGLKTPPDPAKR